LLFGATHDRANESLAVADVDHQRNLASLAEVLPTIASTIDASRLSGRAGVRAATPDRMPVAGALGHQGLYVLSGLGSRGFTTAPLLGEHIAALICGAPSPLPADQQRLVDPSRPSASPPNDGPGSAA
jgi:tRNA 5-methylaminomethyl-2-thiouridine biosynthesis bifunctional protein